MTCTELTLYGTFIYMLLAPVVTFLVTPDECQIRKKTILANSTRSFQEETATYGCGLTYNTPDVVGTHGHLQHFSYRNSINVGYIILEYTCCRKLLYNRHELSSCKYRVSNYEGVCLAINEMKHRTAEDCKEISPISYPIIWSQFNYSGCPYPLVGMNGHLCCEIQKAECVQSNDSCELFAYTSQNCRTSSEVERFANTDCYKKNRKLHKFMMYSNCTAWDTNNKKFRGYSKITYTCCPATIAKKDNLRECIFIKEVTDYCKTGHTNTQPTCMTKGFVVWTATSEQRCDCLGGPKGELVTYACCSNPDMCPRIPSHAFPNLYRFNETLYEGANKTITIKCAQGSLERVCTKSRNQAKWSSETNYGCKIDEMAREDTCLRIPSAAFPYDYSFDNTSHNGSDIMHTVACHKGSLQRVCSRNGNQATWGIEVNNGCKTADIVMTEAIRDTENGIHVSTDKVDDIVDTISGVVEEAAKNKALAKKMLSLVGNLMKMDDKMLLTAKKESGRHKVVSILESFSSLLQMLNNCVSNVVATEDISVGTHCIDRRSKALVVESNFHKEDAIGTSKTIKGPLVAMSSDVVESIQVGSDTVQMIAYSSSKLFVNAKTVNYSSKYNVITVLSDQNMTFETNQTVVLYKIPMDNRDSRNFTCVYWDTKTGNWSAHGIDLITDKNGDKVCRSTHLSSFYILMDIDPGQRLSEIDESYLTYISYIGCGVSIIGLLLTILTYALFKSLHGDVSGKILLNICFSILLLNVVFLLGSLDSETYDVEICMAVAIAMHYFLLATLLWMMIEALNMYQMLIVVFSEHRRWYMRLRLLAGWGVPLVAVGVTMAVSIDNYKPNNQFCFLSHTNQAAFFAAVLAPTCIILFVNTYVFIRVSVIVLRSAKSLKDTRSSSSTSTVSITQVRGAMSVMIVLGITWILGPLAIGPAKVVFAYMFTILNSIQGFLVFLFRCAFNSEARISWQYFIATGKLKKQRGTFLESSTGTWTRSTEHRRKTKKYKSVSASRSGDSLPYRKEHTFPDDLYKTPRSIECERNFGEFKSEDDTKQGGYRGERDINDIGRKCSEISFKDSQVDRSPSGGFVEPETVGGSFTKRFDSEAFDIRDLKTDSPRIVDSTTSFAKDNDRNRDVTITESDSQAYFDTTSKQSMRKEVAKMKRNRYGSSQSSMTSKQPTEPSSLSTSQTVRGGLTRIRSGRYRYGKTGTSRANVSKQPSSLSMSLREGRMRENVNRHGY